MATLHDMLGVDESDGISDSDVEEIKRLLARIKVEAAEVTKSNDAPNSIILLREMVARVRQVGKAGVSSITELHAHLAKSSDGSFAAALGSGTNLASNGDLVLSDEERVFIERMRTATPTTGQWNAISRIMNPDDLQHIEVDDRGTPKEITELAAELSAAKAKRDEAQRKEADLQAELTTERDENKPNSLAGKLKAANSAALPTNVVDRAKVKAELDKIPALAKAKTSKVRASDAVVPDTAASQLVAVYAKLQELAR